MKGSCLALLMLFIYADARGQSAQEVPRPDSLPIPAFTAPPADAQVLFDGRSLDQWTGPAGRKPRWKIKAGILEVGGLFRRPLFSKRNFGDVQLHLEWRTPEKEKGKGQNRGNSGVKLMGLYEVQILESYANETDPERQAGSIYNQYAPLVNASLPPGSWQTYDILFKAPVFSDEGQLVTPALITVYHNGHLIQDNVVIKGPTRGNNTPYSPHPAALPLMLQHHGSKIQFRNIWACPQRCIPE